MRHGPTLGLTVASLARWRRDDVASLVGELDGWSMHSLWVAETTGTEAFSQLADLAPHARGSALGTGVIALPLRTPQLAAMGAATLQAAHPDREVYLGVGVSSPAVVERWHGLPYPTRPLAQMRDALTLMRACLSGEVVDHRGEFYSASRFRLSVKLGERRPRLVLAALNEKMLRLAGEAADGVLLNYLPSSAVPWCIEQVRAGEAAAGRPAGSCRVHAYVHVGVSDPERYRDLARRDLFSYGVVDAYARAFARAGFADEIEELRRCREAGDREGAVAAISDRMCDAIDTIGDAATVTEAVRRYLDAGLDEAVVMPLPWGDDQRQVVVDTCRAAAAALTASAAPDDRAAGDDPRHPAPQSSTSEGQTS